MGKMNQCGAGKMKKFLLCMKRTRAKKRPNGRGDNWWDKPALSKIPIRNGGGKGTARPNREFARKKSKKKASEGLLTAGAAEGKGPK